MDFGNETEVAFVLSLLRDNVRNMGRAIAKEDLKEFWDQHDTALRVAQTFKTEITRRVTRAKAMQEAGLRNPTPEEVVSYFTNDQHLGEGS